jgi:hypothetical protein
MTLSFAVISFKFEIVNSDDTAPDPQSVSLEGVVSEHISLSVQPTYGVLV